MVDLFSGTPSKKISLTFLERVAQRVSVWGANRAIFAFGGALNAPPLDPPVRSVGLFLYWQCQKSVSLTRVSAADNTSHDRLLTNRDDHLCGRLRDVCSHWQSSKSRGDSRLRGAVAISTVSSAPSHLLRPSLTVWDGKLH